ncbi:MAG: hypothetical protein ACYTF6_03445 [Planctomycetota bacterium]|jgi:hypothetical protein
MPGETIESFVAKLQAEGVEAGKQAAEKLKAEAQRQAERTLEAAKAEAEKIAAQAKAEAEKTLARSKTELKLAARDTVLKLRDSLNAGLSAVLARGAKEKLSDVDFLGTVLHELVMLYARDEQRSTRQVKINVRPELRDKLANWALGELGGEEGKDGHHSIDLKGSLSQAGFEYQVSGATTEVTLDSVVAVLSELVSPALRELLDKAMAGDKDPD